MKRISIIITLLYSIQSYSLDCDLTLTTKSVFLTWDGASRDIQQEVKSSTGNSNVNCKNYFITFEKGRSGTYQRKLKSWNGNQTLDYNLYQYSNANNVLVDYNDITQGDDYINGTYSSTNITSTDNFYFNLPSLGINQAPLVSPGYYFDTVGINLYRSTRFSSPEWQKRNEVYYAIYIPSIINISLVDTGGSFDSSDTEQTLDFGELEQNEIQSFDMRVQSNTSYNVYFESQNKGKLKHHTKNNTISYELRVDNKKKSLKKSGRVLVASNTGVTPADGVKHVVSVKIKSIKNRPDGRYSDYITVTAEAN